jgi:hypothetical protein
MALMMVLVVGRRDEDSPHRHTFKAFFKDSWKATSGAGERVQTPNAKVPRDRARLEVITIEGPQVRRVAGPLRHHHEALRGSDGGPAPFAC